MKSEESLKGSEGGIVKSRFELFSMRKSGSIEHRHQFFRGMLAGTVIVIIKFIFYLPVDVANVFYGASLLVTLIITVGELLESRYFVLEARVLDFLFGFLFPLDCYAVLILLGVHLTN
ncbi:MAG TPA: hypothetical protein VFF30_12285 [Nitrososphaerales archaeon]|nr:hypothetical protein [Nitrososphaerales archaeon]